MVLGSSGFATEPTGVLFSKDELKGLLETAQWLLLPQEVPVVYEAGTFYFLPGTREDETFLASLLERETMEEGLVPVIVVEDKETRETLFLDAEGNPVDTAPPAGTAPAWWLEMVREAGQTPGIHSARFDPSHVSISVKLFPLPFVSRQEPTTGVDVVVDPGTDADMPDSEGGQAATPDGSGAGQEGVPLGTNSVSRMPEVELPVDRTVHVDVKTGSDSWNGRARRFQKELDGPKQTVGAGLLAVVDGGRMVVHAGRYGEDLDVRGRRVLVRFDGHVDLRRRETPPVLVEAPPVETHSTTGMPVNVKQ